MGVANDARLWKKGPEEEGHSVTLSRDFLQIQ
jgi:hypothetical protein